MRVAIIGSRAYPAMSDVRLFVRKLPRDTIVISGGADGVDWVAENEAKVIRLSRLILEPIVAAEGVSREVYRQALLDRNKKIADTCERLVAFHDGVSTGTLHTIQYARRIGRPVEVRTP